MSTPSERHSLRATRAALALALAFAVTGAAFAAGEPDYESVPEVRLDNLLPGRLLQSPHHRVRNEVEVDGNSYRLELESDFGVFDVRSLAMLEVRVHEVRTIAQAMNQYARSNEELGAELRGQLEVRSDSVEDILTSPFSTAAQLATQLTNNIGETIAGENPRRARPAPRERAAEGTEPVLAAHKRNIASQLDLDVYSTNPKVQEFLDVIARARSGGKIRAGVGLSPVARRAEPTVAGGRLDREIRSLLRRLSVDELEEGIGDELERIGVAAPVRARLSGHPALSPRHMTVIVNYLDYLEGVGNRAEFVNAIADAGDESEALAAELSARMFALYHEQVDRLAEFRSSAGLPVAATGRGAMVVVFPFDTLFWTADTEALIESLARDADSRRHGTRDFVTAGTLTAKVEQGLARYGFNVRQRFLDP